MGRLLWRQGQPEESADADDEHKHEQGSSVFPIGPRLLDFAHFFVHLNYSHQVHIRYEPSIANNSVGLHDRAASSSVSSIPEPAHRWLSAMLCSCLSVLPQGSGRDLY